MHFILNHPLVEIVIILFIILKKDNIKKVTDLVVMRGTTKLLNSHPCTICTGLIKMYFTNVRVWYFDSNKNIWKCELMGD